MLLLLTIIVSFLCYKTHAQVVVVVEGKKKNAEKKEESILNQNEAQQRGCPGFSAFETAAF